MVEIKTERRCEERSRKGRGELKNVVENYRISLWMKMARRKDGTD